MSDQQTETLPAENVARRRAILYSLGALLLLGIVVYAVTGISASGDDKPKAKAPTATPVIVGRIQLKAVKGESGSGLAELLNRNDQESLRVIASKLPPNQKDEAYQLVLAGGKDGERMLGNAVVGKARVFVGEAKLGFAELERYKRVELRRVTRGENPTAELVLRGRIPR